MCVAFRVRSVLAPMLGLLLAAALPGVADEGSAVISDPSRNASIGGSMTETIPALGGDGHLIARVSPRYNPKAALKLPDVGHMRQLPPEGSLVGQSSNILALYGRGREKAIEVKSIGPFIKFPDDGLHKGILE